ncbi:hypothetical protein ACJX0J_038020, partial [Zea mays]
ITAMLSEADPVGGLYTMLNSLSIRFELYCISLFGVCIVSLTHLDIVHGVLRTHVLIFMEPEAASSVLCSTGIFCVFIYIYIYIHALGAQKNYFQETTFYVRGGGGGGESDHQQPQGARRKRPTRTSATNANH